LEADVGIDAGAEDGEIDGFGDEVIGAGLEALDLMLGVGVGSEHDDGGLGDSRIARGADEFADLGAVEIGHLVIEDDEGGAGAFEELEGLGTALALDDVVVVSEGSREKAAAAGFVIDDENPRTGGAVVVWRGHGGQ
jgi:hypothetical protein